MPIQNMPASLQNAIQQGFLETEFRSGLTSAIGYRNIADRESVSINVGETVTKTRRGLKAPVTTPLSPSANTNLDNGITPTSQTIEQYVLGIDQYADSIDLNIVTSQVGIANQFLANAITNGVQARQSLDRLARKVNEILKAFFLSVGVELVDFKLEFGKLPDGTLLLADEISPDCCRFWEVGTGKKLDKDRFRQDLGGIEDAYQDMLQRVTGK